MTFSLQQATNSDSVSPHASNQDPMGLARNRFQELKEDVGSPSEHSCASMVFFHLMQG
mgnify:CR=1 FL=1